MNRKNFFSALSAVASAFSVVAFSVVALVVAFVVAPVPVGAKEVSAERAGRAAEACVRTLSDLSSFNLRSSGAVNATNAVSLAYASSALRGGGADYYVFNVGEEGFIVVSGDDRAVPVLGYSSKGKFVVDSIAPALAWYLERYRAQIAALDDSLPVVGEWNALEAVASSASAPVPAAASVVYLETAEWGQGSPYNLWCPVDGNEQMPTGCVATAMAIVLKYHSDHWSPTVSGTGSHSYVWRGQTLGITFGTYDWSNMPLRSSGIITDAQRNAVATLIYHCGIAVDSEYDRNGTGAYLTGTAEDLAEYGIYATSVQQALPRWFGFSGDCKDVYNEYSCDAVEYARRIRSELISGRPVLIAGTTAKDSYSGHCWTCAGYDDSDKFYFNWGWEGVSNGWFRLDANGSAPSSNQYGYNLEMLTSVYRIGVTGSGSSGEGTVYIHDTIKITVHDTLTLTAHDTITFATHDTLTVHDTVLVFVPGDPIYIHDTVPYFIPIPGDTLVQHDTVTVIQWLPGETVVQHDTVIQYLPGETIIEYDTVQLPGETLVEHDTIFIVIEEATGVRYPVTETARATSVGDNLYIQGLTPGASYTVYTVNGQCYAAGTISPSGICFLPSLPPGLYLLWHSGQYLKFVHK